MRSRWPSSQTEVKKEGAALRAGVPKKSLRRARSNEVSLQGCSVEISPKVERSKSSTNNTTWMSSGCTFARQTKGLLRKLRRISSTRLGSCSRQCAYRRNILRYTQSWRKAGLHPRLKYPYIFSFWEAMRASLLDVLCAGQPQTSLLYTLATRLVCAVRSN